MDIIVAFSPVVVEVLESTGLRKHEHPGIRVGFDDLVVLARGNTPHV